jgi:molybdopterin/thiamine biosynthesis adenylyltransferase
MNHPLIIGAGGVASYLLPVLLKTFRPQALTIVDKDVLEERNLDRQMFDPKQVGESKAHALWGMHCADGTRIDDEVIHDWFSDSTVIPEGVDAIICCADNHEARYAAIKRAYTLNCYAYIGGNEYLDSQAFAYHPSWIGTPRDPTVRYPEIKTSKEGSPFRCTGDAQIASPQLAIANFSCAAKILHLLWVYERWLPEHRHELEQSTLERLPYELFTSLTENSNLPTHG